MLCSCGGIMLVTRIEEYPKKLTKVEQLSYNRVCDVECAKCGKVSYSQPYDDGSNINAVKKIKY